MSQMIDDTVAHFDRIRGTTVAPPYRITQKEFGLMGAEEKRDYIIALERMWERNRKAALQREQQADRTEARQNQDWSEE